jgi:hypothetical protein
MHYCKKPGHSIETCWAKGGGKEGQGPKQKKKSKQKKKRGKEKANVAEETSSEEKDKDESPVVFVNVDYAALGKEVSKSIIILDTGASSHMTPHKNLLRNYCPFTQPRKI